MAVNRTTLERVLRFDRWDFLATRILLIVSVAITALFNVVLPLADWLRGRPLIWQLQTAFRPRADQLKPGVHGVHDGTVTVSITDAPAGTWVATLVPGLITCLIAGVLVWLVWRLLGGIQAGHPFVAGSVTWLRAIAATLILGPIPLGAAFGFANGSVTNAAISQIPPTPIIFLTIDASASNGWLLVGLGLLVAAIAEAFAKGARLQEDVDGLV